MCSSKLLECWRLPCLRVRPGTDECLQLLLPLMSSHIERCMPPCLLRRSRLLNWHMLHLCVLLQQREAGPFKISRDYRTLLRPRKTGLDTNAAACPLKRCCGFSPLEEERLAQPRLPPSDSLPSEEAHPGEGRGKNCM